MQETTRRYKNIGIITAIVVAIPTFILVQWLFFKPLSLDEQLKRSANILNAACPVKVDEETRLDSATVLPGNVFQYNYTLLHLEQAAVNVESIQQEMQPYLADVVKTNPELKIFRKNNTTMNYCYWDKNGIFLFKIAITPDIYQ